MDTKNKQSDHLSSLNERQKEAVLAVEGPVLVLAGAGAGKTKTITSRILEIIKRGTSPDHILAITFTNKAAHEMADRVSASIAGDALLNFPLGGPEKPFVSTFHALSVHILRDNSHELGLPRHFSIYDRQDSKQAVREALENLHYNPKQYEPGKILSIISREKGKAGKPDAFLEKADYNPFAEVLAETWKAYDRILRNNKALDFDDLLLEALRLLKEKPAVLEHYQNRWQYIHVDEYQDTNRVQYEIANLLAKKHRNIFAVGDIDQTIYTWRGAHIKNLLEFEKDYPEVRIVLLEENYRSSKNILDAANSVIKKNKLRVEKNLFTKKGEGERLGIYAAYDENDEASFIALKAQELIENGTRPENIAVLYRANFQSRALEEQFLHADVPYQVLGTRFYERKEVKDLLSYIKAAENPESLADFKRIINVPARGIGKLTLLKIFAGKENELPPKMQQKIADFRNLLGKIRQMAETEPASKLVKSVLSLSGIEAELKHGTEEDKERLENIRELASLAAKYDEEPGRPGLEKFLSDAALASDQDELKEEKKAVRLMTVHASKGLEFDYVFISGLETDLFPHKKIGEEKVTAEADEEERRLFYVALTRARKKLFLTYASVRTIFGSRQVNLPSEFLGDIDENLYETETHPGTGLGGGAKTIYLD